MLFCHSDAGFLHQNIFSNVTETVKWRTVLWISLWENVVNQLCLVFIPDELASKLLQSVKRLTLSTSRLAFQSYLLLCSDLVLLWQAHTSIKTHTLLTLARSVPYFLWSSSRVNLWSSYGKRKRVWEFESLRKTNQNPCHFKNYRYYLLWGLGRIIVACCSMWVKLVSTDDWRLAAKRRELSYVWTRPLSVCCEQTLHPAESMSPNWYTAVCSPSGLLVCFGRVRPLSHSHQQNKWHYLCLLRSRKLGENANKRWICRWKKHKGWQIHVPTLCVLCNAYSKWMNRHSFNIIWIVLQ